MVSVAVITAVIAVATAIGSVVQGFQAASAAKAQKKAFKQQALFARQQAAADEARSRRQAIRTISAQRAGFGAAGVTSEGSPLEVLGDSIIEAELDALTIRFGGNVRAAAFDAQADQAGRAATSSIIGGFVGAGTSLLIGGDRLARIPTITSTPRRPTPPQAPA